MKYVQRKKNKDGFQYYDEKNQIVTNQAILNKISKIYIAPAYKNVRIFPNSDDLLAYGYDNAGRKQYVYSEKFKALRESKKYCKLIRLGKMIHNIHRKIESDLTNSYFTKNKIIACILKIIELCNFRSGTRKLEEKHGSHGITTIHKKHVKLSNNQKKVEFEFIGKKQVNNFCILNNEKLSAIIHKIYQLSNQSPYLFDIINEKGEEISITIHDLNEYLEPFHITTKDLRTWNANLIFLKNIQKELNQAKEWRGKYNEIRVKAEKKKWNIETVQKKEMKMRQKIIKEAIKQTAHSLHHTPAICKKSYLFKNLVDNLLESDQLFFKIKNYRNNMENDLLNILQKLGGKNKCSVIIEK